LRISILAFLLAVAALGASHAARRLTLTEAVDLALRDNPLLKIARLKVRENSQRSLAVRADSFPRLTNEANLWQTLNRQQVTIPAGIFGQFPEQALLPPSPIRIEQGGNSLLFTSTTLGQPLTQLIKLHHGRRIAALDTDLAATDVRRAEHEIALKVHELYFALLIAQQQRRAAEALVAAAEERLEDSRRAVEAGTLLEVAAIGSRASLLEKRHARLALDNQLADLAVEFNDLLGLAPDTALELVPPPPLDAADASPQEYLETALAASTEVRAAQQTLEKARSAVRAAKADYLPELSVFGQHIYQSGVPFLARNNGIIGLRMNWNVFDFGKRADVVGERNAQLAQAEENLRRQRARVRVEVEKAWRKVERARQMNDVAREALALRREQERLNRDQHEAGVNVLAAYREASAALAKAEADALAADLNYRLARAELERTVGRLPR
jgi:outer membrane protein TolC